MNRRKLSSEDSELFSSLCPYWCRGKHSITGKTFILIEIILLASYELNKRQRRLLSCGILSLLTTVWQKVVAKGGKNMEVDWDWTSCSRHASGRNRQQGWRLTVGVRDLIIGVSPLCTAALFNWRLPKLLRLKWKHALSTEKKPSAPFFFVFQLENASTLLSLATTLKRALSCLWEDFHIL